MKAGFTLIELLVVGLMIGILSAVALPQYQKAVAKTRYKQLQIMARSIANAQEIFYLANQEYATTFEQLGFDTPDNSTTNTTLFANFQCNLMEEGRVTCRSTAIANDTWILYEIFSQHGPSPNLIKCSVTDFNENSLLNQICKAETGLATYSDQNEYTLQWVYPN